MPELPEVELMRRVIGPQIAGQRIARVEVPDGRAIARPDAAQFVRALEGQTFGAMERRGKFSLIRLESGDRLILHLRMTGWLLVEEASAPREAQTRVVFLLGNGRELRFTDLRRFGRFWLVPAGCGDTASGLAELGPEPDDARITAGYLYDHLGRSRRAIKTGLMDQTVVAGIGNIYSDEILFTTGIDPARPACALEAEDWERLAAAIPRVMAFYVEKNEMSAGEYLETRGREYRNTPYLRVYGRAGRPCVRCGEALTRSVIGGRGSVRCPKCQR